MSKLNTIFEALQSKIDAGEITLETANQVLDKAKAKYTDESVGELREAADAPLSLEDAINGINAILNEAEELHKDAGTATTSSDGPDLPDKTSTGEGTTDKLEDNADSSEKKMENLADKNDENAKADAQGEEGKDSTVNADDVTEADHDVVEEVNHLRLRVFEAAEAGNISAEDKALFLEYLDLNNYSFEKSEDDDDEEEEEDKEDKDKKDDEEDEDKKDKKKDKKDDDEEECDHEDKDGDGECDKCGADMEESADQKILEAYAKDIITTEQAIKMLKY